MSIAVFGVAGGASGAGGPDRADDLAERQTDAEDEGQDCGVRGQGWRDPCGAF